MTGATHAQAAALAQAAHAAGTRVAFGVPGGGVNLTLIAALADAGIDFVLTRSESGAVFAAAAYADLAAVPGLALCTRGPGLVAAALGSASALLDGQAVVIATDGAGAGHPHQRIDHAGLAAVVARAITTDGAFAVRAARTLHGPVILDLGAPAARDPTLPRPPEAPTGPIHIAGTRPVLIAGSGARAHAATVRRLVAGRRIPVLTTYRAKGVVPDAWSNAAGLFTGFPREGAVLDEADAIVTVGLDPVELLAAPWPWSAPVTALVERSPADRAQLPHGREIHGPIADLLARLDLADDGWTAEGAQWREELSAALDVPAAGLAPQDVVRAARKALPAGAAATVDAGAHMLVAMPFWPVDEPGECLISSGLATMGFALPAAIGAGFARAAPIVCFVGDGGLGMSLAELETLARTRRDVRVIVFDDAALSLIRIKQTGHPTDVTAVSHGPVDFAAIARAVGLDATTATTTAEVTAACARRGPHLVAARIDPAGYGAILDAVRGG